jgi:4-hydroxy-tetrahydrodipicolinate synthase
VSWSTVLPAVTTPFRPDLSVDHDALAAHVAWLLDEGCGGVVPCGSLGEGASLSAEERGAVVRTCVEAAAGRAPVVPGIAAASAAEAAAQAIAAAEAGAGGLMVLPPYTYSPTAREAHAHIAAVVRATDLPCMLYNNPGAYGMDFLPELVAALADDLPNLEAVKESSGDVRRISAIRALVGDRLALLVGLDDAVMEGFHVGASGWIAGLVNALPRETMQLFAALRDGRDDEAWEIYAWFLPLLRMDTVPRFVQLIKLVQAAVGGASTRVRPPRLELEGAELREAREVIDRALAARPVATA